MMAGYPQMAAPGYGYPGAMPTNYPMAQQLNAQQAMYGDGSGAPADAGGPMDPSMGSGPDGSCPACGGGCCPPFVAAGYVYGDFELFYARRTDGYHDQALIIDVPSGDTIIGAHALNFNYEPGVRATAGYMWSQGFGVEGTYFGQFNFNRGVIVNSTAPTLAAPTPGVAGTLGDSSVDFTADTQMSVFYTSQLHNGELNFVLPYGSFQWLAGFRFVQVQESLDFSSSTGVTASDYTIHTNNNLYLGQIGARGQWEIGRFQFEASAKAGIGDNATNEQQVEGDLGNTATTMASATKSTVCFVGEVDLTALISLSEHWTGRLGYNAVWVTDLALAPNQLDFNFPLPTTNSVNRSGDILLHGFTAGLEFRY